MYSTNALSNFPVYLRTFEEHLKRQIQDPTNIEHFFQVWFPHYFEFSQTSTSVSITYNEQHG